MSDTFRETSTIWEAEFLISSLVYGNEGLETAANDMNLS